VPVANPEGIRDDGEEVTRGRREEDTKRESVPSHNHDGFDEPRLGCTADLVGTSFARAGAES